MAVSPSERLRSSIVLDCVVASLYFLEEADLIHVLRDCAHATAALRQGGGQPSLDPKGLWRVDKDKDPELRHTVLSLVAFHDLQARIAECGGDRDRGIESFLNQNDGEGWLLPETLRLADYGLGHDDRAEEPQPVASRLGPRFYDWQLAQSSEESWRECHLHARNQLGKAGYLDLLARVLGERELATWEESLRFACDLTSRADLIAVFAPPLAGRSLEAWPRTFEEIRRLATVRNLALERSGELLLLGEALLTVPRGSRARALRTLESLVERAGLLEILASALDRMRVAPGGVLKPGWLEVLRAELEAPALARLLGSFVAEEALQVAEPPPAPAKPRKRKSKSEGPTFFD